MIAIALQHCAFYLFLFFSSGFGRGWRSIWWRRWRARTVFLEQIVKLVFARSYDLVHFLAIFVYLKRWPFFHLIFWLTRCRFDLWNKLHSPDSGITGQVAQFVHVDFNKLNVFVLGRLLLEVWSYDFIKLIEFVRDHVATYLIIWHGGHQEAVKSTMVCLKLELARAVVNSSFEWMLITGMVLYLQADTLYIKIKVYK